MAVCSARRTELLAARQLGTFTWQSATAKVYTNPLGQACFELEPAKVELELRDLETCKVLEAGLVFVTEVRPAEGEKLSARARRVFRQAMGCPPIVLACLACGMRLKDQREQHGLRADASLSPPEREVEAAAGAVIEALLRRGAKVNAPDVGPLWNTALHTAARVGAPRVVSALIRSGADCTARNSDGYSAETLASRAGNVTCEEILQVAAAGCARKAAALVADVERSRRSKSRRSESQASRSPSASERKPHQGARSRDKSRGRSALRPTRKASAEGRRGQAVAPADAGSSDSGGSGSASGDTQCESGAFGALRLDYSHLDMLRAKVAKRRQTIARDIGKLDEIAEEAQAAARAAEDEEQRAAELRASASRFGAAAEAGEAAEGAAQAAADPGAAGEAKHWEEQAAEAGARAAELEAALAEHRAQQRQALRRARALLRTTQRPTKGLDEYLYRSGAAQLQNEELAFHLASERCAALEREIRGFAARLPVSGDLRARLPPLLAEAETDVVSGDGAVARPVGHCPAPEALEAHRRLAAEQRRREDFILQLLESCNIRFDELDMDLSRHVDQAIEQIVPQSLAGEDAARAWADVAARAGRRRCWLLEELSQRPQ